MGNFTTSDGTKISKQKIDRLVTEAKKRYLDLFFEEHGYLFCEHSLRSDLKLDCSHIISVNECQNSGRSELAYDLNNLELLCRDEHLYLENLGREKREDWYKARKKGLLWELFKMLVNDDDKER